MKAGLYLRTVRHLRPIQLYGRLWFRLNRPRPDTSLGPRVREGRRSFLDPCSRPRSVLGPSRFRFLSREGTVERSRDWNDPGRPRLWLYNLHYFDDLNATGAESRRDWHQALIQRWIDENPPGEGTGWEPYPTSLRIVNWVKWALREGEDPEGVGRLRDSAVQSLVVQARWLARRLEHHLLGNNFLANAKALSFAGLFFEGKEAQAWYALGRRLLEREIEEQVLEDGGHFERSPMYHALVLEDLLDLVNLHRCYGRALPEGLTEAAASMAGWLRVMRHPDGEIPFFNDAAFGVVPPPAELDEYADRLKLSPAGCDTRRPVRDLPATGYVRLEAGPAVVFMDVAPIGPDYLPAHAHADTLSFELSLGGRRLFVNCGTSQYEAGPRRQWERGTAAHNTVQVDGEDSSEAWAAFRVGRRARITERSIRCAGPSVHVAGGHDGYRRLRGRPIHRREWRMGPEGLEVLDRVEGSGRHAVDVRLHVHPVWETVLLGDERAAIAARDEPLRCEVRFRGPGRLEVERNRYAPEFRRLEPIDTLRYRVEAAELPVEVRTRLSWHRDGREASG